MITQQDLNKVLLNLNQVLANIDERLKKLEDAQPTPKRTTSNSNAKS